MDLLELLVLGLLAAGVWLWLDSLKAREIGVRHEDCIFITETGAENFTKWTGTPEDPSIV